MTIFGWLSCADIRRLAGDSSTKTLFANVSVRAISQRTLRRRTLRWALYKRGVPGEERVERNPDRTAHFGEEHIQENFEICRSVFSGKTASTMNIVFSCPLQGLR